MRWVDPEAVRLMDGELLVVVVVVVEVVLGMRVFEILIVGFEVESREMHLRLRRGSDGRASRGSGVEPCAVGCLAGK